MEKTRTVPLVGKAKECVLDIARGKKDSEKLFDVDPASVRVCMRRIAHKIGVKRLYPHLMRHILVTDLLVNREVPLPVVMELAGHASAATTIRYAHPSLEKKREAVAKLGYIKATR
jgi:integrase